MKRLILITSILGIGFIYQSCRQEELSNVSEHSSDVNLITDGQVVNGRLYFPNIESLRYAYDKVKDEEDEVIADYIDDKDFLSLRPIITPDNENIILKEMELRAMELNSSSDNLDITPEDIEDHIDDLEEIIGDDAYAAFLNSDAEIQVADKIYKYTDVGLFIVQDEKYSDLKEYLNVHKISDNLLRPTDENIKNQYITSHKPNNSSQPMAVSKGIGYFIDTTMPVGNPYTDLEADPYSPPNPNNLPINNPPINIPENHIEKYVNSLPYCSPSRGLFRGLFGQNNVCINKYEKRRRIKLKAFNYNYYLVYHTGVKVKHQYKGWTGGWRKEKADEMRLGVISATFTYDYSNHFHATTPPNRITTIYNNNSRLVFDANVKWEPGFYPYSYNISSYSIQGYPSILKDDFYIEDILGKYSDYLHSNNAHVDKAIYEALKAGNKHLTHQYLNQKFWDESINYLRKTWTKLGKPIPDNNITYSLNIPELGKIVIAKTFYRTEYNISKIDRTFDWGFQVGLKINGNGSVSGDFSGKALKKPEDFKANLYGLIRKNGQWHGIKMITKY